MRKKAIKIKNIIGLLVSAIILITVFTTWYVSSNQYKETLSEAILEQNYRYSQNVVGSTTLALTNMDNNLNILAEIIGDGEFNQTNLDDWLAANHHYFNSLFTTDANGIVQLMSPRVVPNNPNQVAPGTKITSPLMKQALKEQKPFISDPYFSQTGNLMILISQPIFDRNGRYQGVVDGTIYLERENSLEKLLNHHEFLEETTVFVVDRTGTIIYHPHLNRINDQISDHPLIQKVMQGKSGADQIINCYGEEYFSGYGFIEKTGWGVITQTPTSVIDEPLSSLRQEMTARYLPILALSLIIAWLFAFIIAKPLIQLSQYTRDASLTKSFASPNKEIRTHIFEIQELNKDVRKYIELLNKEIQLDGLTNLYNRRTFDLKIRELVAGQRPFSLILLDIDHFKKVNDTYGHQVGDDVLRFLALTIKYLSQENNMCFRYGGEEFAIILEGKDVQEAFTFAENLREKVAKTICPSGDTITISLGVSTYCGDGDSCEIVINQADEALYQSKKTGRNRTSIYQS